jgi:single-stranded-DNA-specific exonuclease
LRRMNETDRPGLLALMAAASVKPGEVDAQDIAFRLGPRINAAGRIAKAALAYQLLLARDREKAMGLARELEQLNRQRRDLTDEAFERAQALIPRLDDSLLMVSDESFAEGIVGLVAGKLQERYNRPVVVVRRGPDDGESRGSARSIAGFHITEALDSCQELLVKHGGHAAAAGFTVATRHLPELEERLRACAAAAMPAPPPLPPLEVDADARLELVNEAVIDQLQALAPFGQNNPEPQFILRGLKVRDPRPSKDGKTLILKLVDRRGRVWRAVGFRQGHLLQNGGLPPMVDVVAHLQREYWQGSPDVKISVLAVRAAE